MKHINSCETTLSVGMFIVSFSETKVQCQRVQRVERELSLSSDLGARSRTIQAFLFDSDITGEKVKNMRQMLQESHSCSLVVRVKPSDRVELLTLHELLAIWNFLLTGGIAQLCTLVNQDHLKKPVASRGFKKQRAGAPKA